MWFDLAGPRTLPALGKGIQRSGWASTTTRTISAWQISLYGPKPFISGLLLS